MQIHPEQDGSVDPRGLLRGLYSYADLPSPAPDDIGPVIEMALARRAGIRALDRFVQEAGFPVEPLSTPNWGPADE